MYMKATAALCFKNKIHKKSMPQWERIVCTDYHARVGLPEQNGEVT